VRSNTRPHSGDPRPGRLVLVAADDEDIRTLVCIQLANAGYETIAARDGEQALLLAHEWLPGLCIFDLAMPKLNGLAATRALRKSNALARVPVIMLTAAAQKADRTRCLEAGADEYMSMPFHAAELGTRVKALLALSRSWSPARKHADSYPENAPTREPNDDEAPLYAGGAEILTSVHS
jgi:two-component system, OmpR family, response regulator MtrA